MGFGRSNITPDCFTLQIFLGVFGNFCASSFAVELQGDTSPMCRLQQDHWQFQARGSNLWSSPSSELGLSFPPQLPGYPSFTPSDGEVPLHRVAVCNVVMAKEGQTKTFSYSLKSAPGWVFGGSLKLSLLFPLALLHFYMKTFRAEVCIPGAVE